MLSTKDISGILGLIGFVSVGGYLIVKLGDALDRTDSIEAVSKAPILEKKRDDFVKWCKDRGGNAHLDEQLRFKGCTL